MEPIAIVGMSCRLPGSANNPEDFWEMLKKGRTAWTPGPGARFNMKAFQDDHGETGETVSETIT
jgi:emericellamide synthase (highly reducing iterative type I polyketide synthase)